MAVLGTRKFSATFAFVGLASILLADVSGANSSPLDRTAQYRDLVAALRHDVREAGMEDKLRVNTKNKIRLIFPDKCENEGEFELHQLASVFSVEEAYVLIPKLCLWIEVGFSEKRNSVRLDSKFIKDVLAQYTSLIFYHIHAGDFPVIENYFPAYKDLITLVLINADSVWKPQNQIKHRLITKLGTIDYKMANKNKVKDFMNKFRNTGLRGYEAQNLAYEYKRPKYMKEYYLKVQECKLNAGNIQQKIIDCCPLMTKAFALDFRPANLPAKIRVTFD